MRLAARIISVGFHPLLLTTYLVALLSYYFPSMLMIRKESYTVTLGLIFVFTFVLPAANILMLRVFGSIQSLSLPTRQERILPIFFIAVLYVLVAFLFFFKLPFSSNFNKILIIIAGLVVMSFAFTLFYKISIHCLAVGGSIGILLPLNQVTESSELLWPTAWAIVALGLVMSSRLQLDVHSPREVMYGSVAGFVGAFLGMTFLF